MPTSDIESARAQFIVASQDGRIVAAGALQHCGAADSALLRSVAVVAEVRRQGLGRRIVRELERIARDRGFRRLILLTQSAGPFFESLGYRVVERHTAPQDIRESGEFRVLCPASSLCLSKELESADLRELLLDAANRAAGYIEQLGTRDVCAQRGAIESLIEALDEPLPREPSPPHEVLAFLDAYGSPATVASAGGRYFGFVTGGALPVTVAAQYLAAGWDQNCFSFVSSPAAACLESTALRWLKEALGLPPSAEGALVTGATMANFTCLAAARNWTLQQHGWDVDGKGLFGAPALTVVLGEEVHATIYKVLSLLGLGRERVVRVPVDAQGRMRADRLPGISGPAVLCMQAGNVNSGAFDPAEELITWARQRNAWVHVDGAFGLWALASAQLAPCARAFVGADSWAMDAHKWLNVPYDCGIAMVRERDALARAMSMSGAYLLPSTQRDAMNYTPDSSRRMRAIEIWAALKSLGRAGLAELVDRNCRQAQQMAAELHRQGVEVLNEVVLNQVVVAFGDDERTRRVTARIQDAGTCWCGGTVWRGRAAMRISVSSWATTDEDVQRSVLAILDAHRSV